MGDFFELRASLAGKTARVAEICGVLLVLGLWWLVTATGSVHPNILPSPFRVIRAVPDLFTDGLTRNLLYSIKLNLMGYLEALVIAIPLGFAIGLNKWSRGLFMRQVSALRFLPLTAVIGLMILWFGIGMWMKVHFLALGILVYLLPVVVQRVDEVENVYLDTIKTLGATKRQTVRKVYIPRTLERLSDDVRVLVAISWTYIIITEVINLGDGGIGAMIYTAARRSRTYDVFALLGIIVLIGFIQDRIFAWLDRLAFPHKHV